MPNKKTMIHAHEFALKVGNCTQIVTFSSSTFPFPFTSFDPRFGTCSSIWRHSCIIFGARVVWWRQRGDFWYTLRRILWFRGCKSQSLFNFSKVDSRILRMILHLLTSITRPPVMNHPTISTKKPRCHWNLKIKQHTSQSIQLEVNKKSSSWLNLKTELLLFGKTFQCSTFTNSFMEKLQPLQPPALAMAAGKVSRIWSTTESLAPQLFTNLFSRTCWKSDPIGGSPTKTHPFLVWLRTHNRIRKRREMRSIWPRWSWKNLTFSCPCSSLGPPAICPLLHEAGKFMYLVVWGPTKGRLPKVKVFLTEPADLLFVSMILCFEPVERLEGLTPRINFGWDFK